MQKPNILFFSKADFSNSGYRWTEAANRTGAVDVTYFAKYPHLFGYNRGSNLLCDLQGKPDAAQHLALERAYKAADVIHFKGDDPPEDLMLELLTANPKPLLITASGSQFRAFAAPLLKFAKEYGARMSATTPDLLIGDMKLLPFCFDESRYHPVQRDTDCCIIGHIPSTKSKGSALIMDAMTYVGKQCPSAVVYMASGLPAQVALRSKQHMHVYIDQFGGKDAYGNSSVEAMMFGCAVVSDCSFPLFGCNANDLPERLIRLATDPAYLQACQDTAYAHFLNTHTYAVVGQKLVTWYKELMP